MNFRIVLKPILLCCGTLFFSSVGHATITTLQSLDFGIIVVTKNNSASSLSIDPAGNIQVIGDIAIIAPGNQAVYEVSDYPPNTSISIEVTALTSSMIPSIASEETFSFSVITTGNSVMTDSNGVALLGVGGTITTSASGSTRFSDADYSADIQITINL
nr:DUF4402 domain-containing protein [uncultured Glaciecola sp.]